MISDTDCDSPHSVLLVMIYGVDFRSHADTLSELRVPPSSLVLASQPLLFPTGFVHISVAVWGVVHFWHRKRFLFGIRGFKMVL